MKKYLLFLCLLCCATVRGNTPTSIKDSLQESLNNTTEEQARLEILTNLMDLSRQEKIVYYAKQLLDEATRANEQYYKEAALTELMRYYVNRDIKDSTDYYLDITNKELTGEAKESLVNFIRTIQDTRIIYYTQGEEQKQLIKENLLKLESNQKLSPYEKMSANYILGISLANNVLTDFPKEDLKQVSDYFINVINAAAKRPLRYSYHLQPNSYYILCNFSLDLEQRTKYAIQYLTILQDYAKTKEMKKRPYAVNKRHLLNAYSSLANGSQYIGKDMATGYYHKFLSILQKYPEEANVTADYELYYTSANYYQTIGNYKKHIDYCDSMIAFLKKAHYEDNIIDYVEKKISAYDSLKMYKEAYNCYKDYTVLLDTLHQQQLAKKLDNLEIQKEVNKLLIEKKELELKLEKSKSIGYSLLALFLFALSITIYISFRLGKMKSLYKKLQESNEQVIIASEKAQESERMKNAFIKNMCHEVRTPLNAINGFSELIANEDTDSNEKKAFSKIIYQNCHNLTVMMNNVLEIAQLDSSKDQIELESIQLHALCFQEMENLKKLQEKVGIEYILEGSKENDTILTNPTYLSVLIAHLLNNANKFTKEGRITLAYQLNHDNHTAIISVTDTGCGIAPDKQEWIFERFTKGDDFVPGSGLGLYLCRMIAQRLNGDIHVDSDYTKGARFILILPICE
ncbi:sensor histidine kinase [Parabacteroides bouchesdurhonensis]|uniref:sensor histidine kinase n=1 Tax=Parabacteroides bouchesdurhonensis TaxID=1936995 RepID=UPI000C8658C4|nr:HAMP domain-containing sensor histidine kinase [Parabacteroides bouchesdurhonensis]